MPLPESRAHRAAPWRRAAAEGRAGGRAGDVQEKSKRRVRTLYFVRSAAAVDAASGFGASVLAGSDMAATMV